MNLCFSTYIFLQLTKEGYPETTGILYRQEASTGFQKPLSVSSMLKKLADPDQDRALEELSQHDRGAIQTLQNLITPMPKVENSNTKLVTSP